MSALLGDPALRDLAPGSSLDIIVVHVHGNIFKGLWHGDMYNCTCLGQGTWTLYGFILVSVGQNMGFLQSTVDSVAFKCSERGASSFSTLVEVCSGIGGISVGACYSGFETLLSVDKAAIACDTIRLNGGQALEGDISSREVQRQISAACHHRGFVLAAGFPCNSFSLQGSGRGLSDSRGQVLLSVLQVAWRNQAHGLLLECVAEVQNFPEALGPLRLLAGRMGFQMHQLVLELGDQWASRRHRWWCVMLPAGLPQLNLQPWPATAQKLVVSDVIAEWPLWPQEEECALAWTPLEAERYADPAFGNDTRHLDMQAQALWITSQIRAWSESTFGLPNLTDPVVLLAKFKEMLIASRQDHWLTPSIQASQAICFETVTGPFELRVSGPTRVRQLIQAERRLLGPGLSVKVFDGPRLLPHGAFLHPDRADQPYALVVQGKAAGKTPPEQPASAKTPGTSDVVIWTGLLRLQAASSNIEDPACPAATLFDGIPEHSLTAAQCLVDSVCVTCDLPPLQVTLPQLPLQVDDDNCGPMLLAFAAHALGNLGASFQTLLEDASSFCRFFPPHDSQFRGCGGLSEAQKDKLNKILLERGVPEAALAARVQAAVQKLGAGPLAKALSADNPWPALKAAGSSPGALFRWVQIDELKAHAQAKAALQFGTAIGNAKARKQKTGKATKPVLNIDPLSLQLASGSFLTADGSPLAQLGFEEVVSQANGIAFCTAQQMLPFLSDFRVLSVDALALVSTAPLPIEACVGAPVSTIRFPAVYAPTQEAVLISGTLLQLGDENVQLASGDTDMDTIDQLTTLTGRVSLFRDEAQLDWTVFTKSPVKCLLQHVPGLNLCRDPACKGDCPAFHPSVEEHVDRMILDVWARQFAKLEGGRTTSEAAELFQALIRVPSSAAKHLQHIHVPGFYFEPRASNGFGPHPAYAVIWLPGQNKQQATHLLRTCDKALGLARLGPKFGLRVLDEHEQEVFQTLRPQQPFVKVKVLSKWRLHPLPHGTQRHALVQLLGKWKWAAKPLQPCRGDSSGCAWEVGSEVDPPATVLQAGETFVLVHKTRDVGLQPKPDALCASSRTRRRILYDDPDIPQSSADPWLGGQDPWSLGRAPPGLPHPPTPASTAAAQPSPAVSKLTQVKSELQAGLATLVRSEVQAVKAQLPSADSSQEARIQKLEVGLQEVCAQNSKFEQWFQTLGTQMSQQADQVVEVQKAVSNQQGELGALKSEVTSSIAQAMSGLQSDMSRQFAAQTVPPAAFLGLVAGFAAFSVLSLWGGVWQYSETQLSSVSLPFASRAIRACTRAQNRDVRIFAGAPAPLRPGSQSAGSWTGVLTTSDYPCRPVQLQWLHDALHTGRVQALQHYINGTPVLTANLYGFPAGKTYVDSRARTERLLESLTKEIVLGRRGVRLISGDFNHWHGHLNQVRIWQQQGWIEAQDLAEARWHQTPVATCKGATRRDFVFLSPEAAALCASVQVHDVFAEHSTVVANLRMTGASPLQSWPLPAEIPWNSVDLQAWTHACTPISTDASSSTRWLRSFAQGFERSLDGFVSAAPTGQLPHRCHGRACRLAPSSPVTVGPPKPARPGEEAMHHDLLSLEVKRWYQQLRRLQSLDHSLRAGNQSPSALEHRLGLWRSIVSARGFHPDFRSWWPRRPVQLAGSPRELPQLLPSAALGHLLFLDFRDNYRKFEAWNIRQRRAILAEQYAQNHNLLFRDLRDPKPEQVDTLEVLRSYSIIAVDPPTGSVHLDADIETRGCSNWQLDGCAVQVTSVDGDVCTIPGCPALHEGAELVQSVVLSSARHIQFEFEQFWSAFWQRHSDPSTVDWSRFTAFAQAYLPRGQLTLTPISLEQWRSALRRFKPRAARGPDGFAKLDLLHMSDVHSRQLLEFLAAIESGEREWPQQWLTGLICCLKKPNPHQGPQGFRPICLLSCAYRAWSGLRARQLLRLLVQRMPDAALGFMPQREASQFWYVLEAQIELACQQDLPFLGFSTDVIKAFNVLPRDPVLQVASWIGFPGDLLRAWASFLHGLERRFLIRDSVGAPVGSNCGFPEGCALSTVAMSVVCLCYHAYVEAFTQGAQPHSYVDNLSCLTTSVGQLASGITVSRTFFDLLGLSTDPDKTYVWAVQPDQQQPVAALGLPVLRYASELGGTLSFGRATRNATLTRRCQDLGPLFGRLQRSPCALAVKLFALPAKFWSHALHGISGCPVGDSVLSTLRAQAVRALQCNPAGTSAMLRLSTAHPIEADPGYFQFWAVVQDLRRLAVKDPRILSLWSTFMSCYDGRLSHGPFSKLLQVFSQVGWRVETPPFFRDGDGFLHNLLEMPKALIRRLSEQAWLNFVASKHRHRQTMSDLHGIDLSLLHSDARRLSALDHARLAALRSGAFMFGACHSRFDLTQDGLCSVCRVPDTHEHRVRFCPKFSEARQPFQWVCELWPTLPTCLCHHLLPPANPYLQDLRGQLIALPDRSALFFTSVSTEGPQHVFCDGSCLHSRDQSLALAAWSSINASTGSIIACGPVPGLMQTAPRAELWGAISSLKWGVFMQTPLVLWIDSDMVGRGLRELLLGHTRPDGDNSDLWDILSDLVGQFSPGQLLVQHVPSHLDSALSTSPFEDWAITWNSHADTLAGLTNLNRSVAFRQAHERVFQWHSRTLEALRALRGIYFGIASATQHGRRDADGLDPDCEEPDLSPPPLGTDFGDSFLDELPLDWRQQVRASCPELPQGFVNSLSELLANQAQSGESWRSISWLEFVFVLHELGSPQFPVKSLSGNQWLEAAAVPLGAPELTVAVQLRLVRKALRCLFAVLKRDDIFIDAISLVEFGVAFKVDGFSFPVRTSLLQAARQRLFRFCAGRKICTVGDLARLC
ncbi:aquIMA [Symbiodinium sp. KB8]|nr:aquIMA [Symbiodinium sp. KB8]